MANNEFDPKVNTGTNQTAGQTAGSSNSQKLPKQGQNVNYGDDNQIADQNPANNTLSENDLKNKQDYKYIIKRKSVRAKARRRTAFLVLMVFALCASLIAAIVYGILSFVDFNSFRITIDRNYNGYLTLADNYDFENASTILSTDGLKYMGDTSYSMINIKELMTKTGSLSKRDYIATAFYLRNQGENGVYYSENITLTNSYKDLEDTIRILLIKEIEYYDEDGNPYWSKPYYRCFAKVAGDGISDEFVAGGDELIPDYTMNPNLLPDISEPWKCTSFYDADSGVVVDTTYYPLLPGQRVRYAMAIWIEGTDPDTTDDKLGGRVSYNFQFSLKYDNGDVVFFDKADSQEVQED